MGIRIRSWDGLGSLSWGMRAITGMSVSMTCSSETLCDWGHRPAGF